jgi:hypothetical protein
MRRYPLSLLPPLLLLLGCARSPRENAARTPSADTVGTDGEPLSAAERVVREEFDAYNRRDLDAFLSTYTADARYVRYPDSVIVAGRDSMRARFGRLFAAAPRLHAKLDARMARGDFVIWQVTATNMPGGKTNTAIFVYEVRGGKISRVLAIP